MLYPRHDDKGKLVTDAQMVCTREHFMTNHRIVFLSGVLGGETETHNSLMALDSISDKPIKLVITSPGGELDSAFLMYDTIKLMRSPVLTLGRYCASAAALLLAVGQERYLMPHSKVMIHLPSGQMGGDARDWEIQSREMKKYKDELVDLFRECGVKESKRSILSDMDRDMWMTPAQAIEYGLADKIISKQEMEKWVT